MDYFEELIAVMEAEHLIRFRRRFEKRGRDHMVKVMTDLIKQREEAENEHEKKEHKKKKK
jgi:hypothetical protein